ncbi:pectinesterase family protein [Allostreptomyces psammosilenae]|uniref:Pectinesterase n=1 Tax=Allostreptomyces psammosilenae TaxID=1892865 RepID=A0A852ZYF2_9ACTN|nr:pectinesterase family protein [Allostreptomyces psammosilenae]NYI06837.1 pectinesterase [Allostreptomyces psammosilenae]
MVLSGARQTRTGDAGRPAAHHVRRAEAVLLAALLLALAALAWPAGTAAGAPARAAAGQATADQAAAGQATADQATADQATAGQAAAPGHGRWSAAPEGFASLDALGQNGTTGGRGGRIVTVTTQEDLARYAAAPEPYVIRVAAAITVQPKGTEFEVASDKTIIGVGTAGEIVQGGFFLGPGTHNVIIRNLTIRDSFVEGDWDGKPQDFDAIQMDGAHHVWIDHNTLTRMGDGLIDIRRDSSYVTVSWNRLHTHNKALAVGWSPNVTAQVTIHHNWFRGIKQRSPVVDNAAHAHLYNNYLSEQHRDDDPQWTYGNWSRGATRMVIENSYYDGIRNPYQADATAELVQRGSILRNTTGRTDAWGDAFDPRAFYDYRLDPAAAVPALLRNFSGPQRTLGTTTVVTVAPDGGADFTSVQRAVDSVPDGNTGAVTIAIAPGTYREQVVIPAGKPYITFRGTGGSRDDVVIVEDVPSGQPLPGGGTAGSTGSATVLVRASDFTAEHLTFVNDFDEQAHPEISGHQALALKTFGDRITFRDVAFKGNQDTLMTDSPSLTTISRVYVADSYIEGDVDFIYGRATTVIERSTIMALSRGSTSNNGYVTAPSTWRGNPYGFLITDSRIESDAPAGTFHLGRPWHPSGNPDAVGQALIRNTWLDEAIKSSPWTDMSGFSWRDARFAEFRNHGPGAGINDDRPQMTAEQAADFEVADYLAGTDGWAPHRR